MKAFCSLAFAAALLSIFTISCIGEVSVDSVGMKTITEFTLEVEECPFTKLCLKNGSGIYWSKEDNVGVYSDTGDMQVFFKYREGDVFRSYGPIRGNKFYGFYPSWMTLDPENGMRLLYDDYGSGTSLAEEHIILPMTAKSDGSKLSFKHAGGVLHLAFKGTQRIHEIVVKGNLGETLCGTYYLDMDEEVPVMRFLTQEWYRNKLYVSFVDGEVPQLSEEKTMDVYFSLPPMTLEKGFTVYLTLDDKTISRSTNKSVTIERGRMKSFTVVDVSSLIHEEEDAILAEREALVALYDALDGPNWSNNTGWCSDKPLGEWYGVTTNDEGRVSIINLSENRLKGELPEEIGAFTELFNFNLGAGEGENQNHIAGFLPSSVSNWKRISSINLSGNWMSGPFPESLRGLKTLSSLYLFGALNAFGEKIDKDYFNGPIPDWIGELSNLQYLYLNNNDFSGELPISQLSKLKLKALSLGNNQFSGAFPDISGLSELSYLDLTNNQFSGAFPDISGLSELSLLGLSNNQFSGAFPDISGLSKLKHVYLNNNQFSGTFPDISRLFELSRLELDDNHFSGAFPDISGLSKLKYVHLTNNQFSGAFPDISRLSELSYLVLHNNQFSGAFPDISGLSKLIAVGLSNNQFSGDFPDISGLSELLNLSLSNNQFSGTFPDISGLSKLNYVYLDNNQFSGAIPDISELPELVYVDLSNNLFSGSVPGSYAKMLDDDQKVIWIWGNNLSGRMPDEIINHRNFSEFAYMLLGDQRPGYKIQIDDTKVPACRHVFNTFSGACMDLGNMYSNADYTMIIRWAEWCPFSTALIPEALVFAKKYREMGLQVIWAYAGGNEGQRIAFMADYGLDKEKYHIVECSHSGFIPSLGDHAVWLSPVYETPFVEIVDREGHLVFISDDYDNFTSYSFSHHTSELESFLYSIFN